uniref:Uncharacterized protein n=1 Tax=viral metagenome TaxID=1070528 RepID=A0A6M3XLD4_9ZZZZ
MKLTNGDIYNARESLMALLEEKMPVAISFKVAKLANKFNVELKTIEDVKNGLIKKYGKPDEKGRVSVPQDSPEFDKFVEEFNELMEQTVEMVVDKIKLSEDLSIEPKTLMALEKFVEV